MRLGVAPNNSVPQGQRLNLRQSQERPPEEDAPSNFQPPSSGGGEDFDSALPLQEAQVVFDDTDGHDHSGTGDTGKQIDHADLTNVTADQHHNQSHVLATNTGLGADHTMSGATSGHVLRATSATTATFSQVQHSEIGGVTADQHHAQSHVLASTAGLGADHTVSGLTSGQVLRATGAATATFSTLQHSELGGVGTDDHHAKQHNLLNSDNHGDTTTGTVTRGDVITGQGGTPKWVRLALGVAKTVFRSDGTDAAWSTGDLDSNARVNVKKAGVSVGIRRGINLVEGSNITLTVSDDSGNEEVDVTIAASASSGTTGQFYIGRWLRSNIGGLTTSATKDRLANDGHFGASVNHPEAAGRAGTVTLLVASLDTAVAGGGSVEVELFVDTGSGFTATGDTGTISSGESAKAITVSHAVAATDLMEVRANRSGTVGSAQLSVRVYLTPS